MDGQTINKKELSEEDIKNRYITPTLNRSGWDNEQKRIVEKINNLMTHIDHLEEISK